VARRRKRVEIVDPRSPRPRLPDAGRLLEDPFGPRSVSEHELRRPWEPRLLAFGGFLILAVAALVYNLYSLQIQQGGHFDALAQGNRVRAEVVLPPRGIIFDRHGNQLVTNTNSFALAVVPVDFAKPGSVRSAELQRLSRGTGIAPADIDSLVQGHGSEPFQPFTLLKDLSVDQYEYFSENLPQLPGARIVTDSTRHYVTGSGISHLLGYVGKIDPQEYQDLHAQGYLLDDNIGKTGLEAVDETYLRGTPGKDVVETDAEGRVVKHLSTTAPVPGDNVYLSIDWNLQQEVAKDLAAGIEKAKKLPNADVNLIHGGAAIVSNPQTGEIYAMVSLPDYDANLFSGGISQAAYAGLLNDPNGPLLNRAIDGLYPPGSTFKPVVASAGLQTGAISPTSAIFDPGHYNYGGFIFYGWNRGGFGNQNVVQAIAHSDDIYFYEVAHRVGDVSLAKFAKDFGVGRKTGIDLGPEARGIAPDRNWKKAYFASAYQATHDAAWLDSTWYEGNTLTYGIGQSYLLVTPLQDLEWMATVANGGSYLKPQLTRQVTSADSRTPVRPFQPAVDHQVSVSPQWLAVVRDGLHQAVDIPSGTAYYPLHALEQKLGVPLSGKTGSAQFGLPDAHGNTPIHAWFSAYGPSTNPEVAVTVFVEAGGEGSLASLPVANQVLDYYFTHRDQIRSTS